LALLLDLVYDQFAARAIAMGRLVGRQRTVYDPNAPLTEEQKAMAEGDRRVIIAAVVATSGVILVLVL